MRIFSIVFAFLFLTLSTPTLYAQEEGSAVAPDPQTTNFDITIVKTEQKSAQKTPAQKLERCLNETESKPACAVVNRKDDKVDMERHFLKLERELLDREFSKVGWWLNLILVVLAFVTIGVMVYARDQVTKSGKDKKDVELLKEQIDELKNQTEKAEEESAQSAKKSAASAAFSEGNVYLGEKKYATAIGAYNRAIDTNPDYADAYSNRGVAKGSSGDHEGAIVDFDTAIHHNPDFADFYNNRGVAKSQLNQNEAAIEDYTKAIDINPYDATSHCGRGVSKSELDRHKEAIEDYTEAIRLNSDYADAYNNRSIAKDKLGHHAEALKDVDEAIRLKPDYADAHFNRALAKGMLYDVDGAREDYKKARDLFRAEGREKDAQRVEKILLDINDDTDAE